MPRLPSAPARRDIVSMVESSGYADSFRYRKGQDVKLLRYCLLAFLAVLAILFLGTGFALLFNSRSVFDGLPDYYGSFNNHFVKDAGLAYLSSGIMLAIAVFHRRSRSAFALCGAFFVVLHGIFHVTMIVNGMVPSAYLKQEIVSVIGPALVTLTVVVLVHVVFSRSDEGRPSPAVREGI